MVVLYYYWLTAYNLPVPYGICECVCVSTFVYVCVCVCKHIGAFPLKWLVLKFCLHFISWVKHSTEHCQFPVLLHTLASVSCLLKQIKRVKGGGLSFASLRWGTYENGLEIYLRQICLFSLIYLFIHIYTIYIKYTSCISVLIWALI